MSSQTDSVALYKMRKLLFELGDKKGRGTELVSLYIPPNKPLHEVSTALREEYGTASNIKSDQTRNHVQDALTKTMQKLKLYPRAPPTGLAMFAGALPTNGPGSEVVFLHEIVPHKPVQQYLYRCDDHFHVEPLKEMLKERKVIGVISMDNTEAGIAIIVGDRFEVVDVLTSGVAGKHRAGGQSARRFERLRDMELNDYYRRIAKHAGKVLIENNNVVGVIISGPGPSKEEFLKTEFLDYRLRQNVLAILDAAYSGEEGVREAVEKAGSVLEGFRLVEERKLMQRFLKQVSTPDGLVTYSVKDVLASLVKGNAEIVVISEDADLVYLKLKCNNCDYITEKVVAKKDYVAEKQDLISAPCRKCASTNFEVQEKDFVEYLADLALESAAKVEVISSRTEEGNILKSFGSVVALLRYR